MSATTLFLSRHGQTVWHAENRYAGISDVDLTERGFEQAQELADWAGGNAIDQVVASPVRRAVQTATPAAQALGMELQFERKLVEMSFGIAEGRTIGELREQDPSMVEDFIADPVAHPFPEAEDPAQAARRGSEALLALAAQHPGKTLLVVAHNTLLRLSLCQLIGVEPRRYRTLFPKLDNGCLSEIRITDDGGSPTPHALSSRVSVVSLNVPLSALST